MSADTLTDAEARVLRATCEGTLYLLPLTGEVVRAVYSAQDRGLLTGMHAVTSAGREALARHEAGERRG